MTVFAHSNIFQIYDEEGRGEPMIVDSIYLSAECYDVMVDCAYENPSENFLNYGNVKVNSTVVREMYLLNRGKYSIYYKYVSYINLNSIVAILINELNLF